MFLWILRPSVRTVRRARGSSLFLRSIWHPSIYASSHPPLTPPIRLFSDPSIQSTCPHIYPSIQLSNSVYFLLLLSSYLPVYHLCIYVFIYHLSICLLSMQLSSTYHPSITCVSIICLLPFLSKNHLYGKVLSFCMSLTDSHQGLS